MKRISTHILDLMQGKPACNVPVRLERQEAHGNWSILGSGRTDGDGRCAQLLLEGDLTPGLYRLVFDTATYFGTLKVEGLFPIIEVTFQAREGDTQLHIPLLLSANGYTTYRGS